MSPRTCEKLKGMKSKSGASKMVLEDNFPKELAQIERRHASAEQETSEHAQRKE